MTTMSLQDLSTAEVSVTAARPVGTTVSVATVPTAADAATLGDWAMSIDADGIGAHEAQAGWVVTTASRLGLCPVLVDVLADTSEPAVARERAFGRLTLALTLI